MDSSPLVRVKACTVSLTGLKYTRPLKYTGEL